MKHSYRLFGIATLITALVNCGQSLNAQSVDQYTIASAGTTAPSTGGSTVTFTIGEPIIATSGSSTILSQGFNQPALTTSPLPIKMEFNGSVTDKGNNLSWRTFTELNNDHFELERSFDGVSYAVISKIKSKAPGGNSNFNIDYSYLDHSFKQGRNIYRLKQVDMDGTSYYSQVVVLDNKAATAGFSLSPNPAIDALQVITPEAGEISIVDVSGKILETISTGLSTRVNVANYLPGVYYLNFKGLVKSTSLRFIKK